MIIKRTELKYFVPIHLYKDISNDLRTYLRPDKHIAKGRVRYDVHSVYFDTRNFRYYYEKIDGEEVRKKFRIRYYGHRDINTNEDFWFEIKEKFGPIIKKTRYLHKGQYILNNLNIDFKENSDAEKIAHLFNKNDLAPVVRVSYKREALVAIYERDTRVTFDSEITGAMVINKRSGESGRDVALISPFLYLLEIKTTDAIPRWLSHIVEKYNLEQTSYSKYAKAIENTAVMRRTTGELYGF